MGAEGRDGAGVTGVGTEDVVQNVEDAIGEENVLLQDAGRVHKERVGREGDGDHSALPGLQRGPVDQAIAVADMMAAVDDVVI